MCFNNSDIEIGDYILDELKKTVKLPVYKYSGQTLKLKKGDVLGTVKEIEPVKDDQNFSAITSTTSKLDLEEIDHGDLKQENVERLHDILNIYDKSVNSYPENEPAKLPFGHEVKLKDGVPVSAPPCRVAYSQRQEIDKQIKSLLERGFIEPSRSPYGSPIVPVVKPMDNCVSVSITGHYRKTIPRTYPIPRVEGLIERLGGSKYFTILDLKDAYWHISIKEEDRPKTAFVLPLPWGKFQWNRMTFGLLDAAFSLSATVRMVPEDCKDFAGAYYDDIIIHSPDLNTHFHHIDTVLTKLAERGLRVNYAKCELAKPSVKFVGFVVSGDGIQPSPAKVEEIIRFDTRHKVESLRAFLGISGCYRRFIPLFSIKSAPLFQRHCFTALSLDRVFRRDALRHSLYSWERKHYLRFY